MVVLVYPVLFPGRVSLLLIFILDDLEAGIVNFAPSRDVSACAKVGAFRSETYNFTSKKRFKTAAFLPL